MKQSNQNQQDPFNLSRFIIAQETIYSKVINELNNGKKCSHWMWYIFPQIEGLGKSSVSKFYALKNKQEARAYLQHPVLGKRLRECTETILAIEERSASQIFGSPDDRKLQSSMTLFSLILPSETLFQQALDRFFQGNQDLKTKSLIE